MFSFSCRLLEIFKVISRLNEGMMLCHQARLFPFVLEVSETKNISVRITFSELPENTTYVGI